MARMAAPGRSDANDPPGAAAPVTAPDAGGQAAPGNRSLRRWALRALAACLVITLFSYGYLAVRFWWHRVKVTTDYRAVVDAWEPEVPEAERAWPALRSILRRTSDEPSGDAGFLLLDGREAWRPGSTAWKDTQRALDRFSADLAELRAATQRPTLGIRLAKPDPADAPPVIPGTPPSVPDEWADCLLMVRLPYLAAARQAARWALADAVHALHRGDEATFEADVAAALDLARLVRRPPTLISQLVGTAILAATLNCIQGAVAGPAGEISPALASRLITRLQALPDERFEMNLELERLSLADARQRLFTDDGAGDGLLAAWDPFFFGLTTAGAPPTPPTGAAAAVGRAAKALAWPVAAAAFHSRAEHAAMVDDYFAWVERRNARPLSQRSDGTRGPVEVMMSSTWKWRWYPTLLLLPALERAADSGAMAKADRDATVWLLAAAQVRKATGAWPALLSPLPGPDGREVPPPVDPWTGEPYQWRVLRGHPFLWRQLTRGAAHPLGALLSAAAEGRAPAREDLENVMDGAGVVFPRVPPDPESITGE